MILNYSVLIFISEKWENVNVCYEVDVFIGRTFKLDMIKTDNINRF